MCVKLQQLEYKTLNLLGKIHDFQQGLDFTNKEVETLKIPRVPNWTAVKLPFWKKDLKTFRTNQKRTTKLHKSYQQKSVPNDKTVNISFVEFLAVNL